VYVVLCFAHALLTFVGEVFGPVIVGDATAARRQAYILVDLGTVPLLAGIFLTLFVWVKELLGRTAPPIVVWVFVAVEVIYLSAFVGTLVVLYNWGDLLAAALGIWILNATIAAMASNCSPGWFGPPESRSVRRRSSGSWRGDWTTVESA
jgi:hypothetical protein